MGCHVDSWTDQKEYLIHEGNAGTWKDSMTMCDSGFVIPALAIKHVIEANHPTGEDMGINGLKFNCVYKDWSGKITKTLNYDNSGSWLAWYEGYTL